MAVLGEAKIDFNKDRNVLNVHGDVSETFLALCEGRGYEILKKRGGNARELMQIPFPPKEGLHSPVSEDCLGTGQSLPLTNPEESCGRHQESFHEIFIFTFY